MQSYFRVLSGLSLVGNLMFLTLLQLIKGHSKLFNVIAECFINVIADFTFM